MCRRSVARSYSPSPSASSSYGRLYGVGILGDVDESVAGLGQKRHHRLLVGIVVRETQIHGVGRVGAVHPAHTCGPTIPLRSAHPDCAAAVAVNAEPAVTPAANTAANLRMRIVGRPRSRHRFGYRRITARVRGVTRWGRQMNAVALLAAPVPMTGDHDRRRLTAAQPQPRPQRVGVDVDAADQDLGGADVASRKRLAQPPFAVPDLLEDLEPAHAVGQSVAGQIGDVGVELPQSVPGGVVAHQPGTHDGAVGVDDPAARGCHRAIVGVGVGDLLADVEHRGPPGHPGGGEARRPQARLAHAARQRSHLDLAIEPQSRQVHRNRFREHTSRRGRAHDTRPAGHRGPACNPGDRTGAVPRCVAPGRAARRCRG